MWELVDHVDGAVQVENGDMNWILPGKFIAFSGPSAKHTEYYGYRTLTPEDYWHAPARPRPAALVKAAGSDRLRRRAMACAAVPGVGRSNWRLALAGNAFLASA